MIVRDNKYSLRLLLLRLSYDEAYSQLMQWLEAVEKQLQTEPSPKGTLVEKQEQLDEYQVRVVRGVKFTTPPAATGECSIGSLTGDWSL